MSFKINDISELNRRVTIKRPTITRNNSGDEVKTFANILTCWAAIDYYRISEQNEMLFSGSQRSVDGIDFYIKYREDFTFSTKDVITYKGNDYDIEAVVEMGFKDYLRFRTVRNV